MAWRTMMCSFAFFSIQIHIWDPTHGSRYMHEWACGNVTAATTQKQPNSSAQHKRTKGTAVEFQSSFSVLISLLCTALNYLLQLNLYSHFPSLIYRTFKVLLAACGWGWGGHSFKWKQILSLWLPLFTLEQSNYRDPRSVFAQGWAGKFRGAQFCL